MGAKWWGVKTLNGGAGVLTPGWQPGVNQPW